MQNRVRGLDGLRGIAVFAVVMYHADMGAFSGGFLGVDVFFVLSGFLITALLIREIETSDRINRAMFYMRRIRRLLPALVLVIVTCVLITGLWIPDAAFGVRRDLPWALTFVLNWSYLFFKESYFVAFSRPPVLQHLWSLAIEEQFYVIWPVVLIVLSKVRVRWLSLRQLIFLFSIGGAVASTWWMYHLSLRYGMPIPHDPSRLYFGTDTHSMSLLVGCAAATLWRPERQRSTLTPDMARLLGVAGWGSFATVLFFLLRETEFNQSLYRGGFLVLACATALMTLVATHPGLRFGALIGNPLMRWLGERSYGIYLWHWPIFMVLRPGLDVSWPDIVTELVRITLVILLAEASYQLVEMPIRRGYLSRTVRQWKVRGLPRMSAPSVALTISVVVLFAISTFGLLRAPTPDLLHASGFSGLTSIDIDPTPSPVPSPSLNPHPSNSPQVHPSTPQTIDLRKHSATIFGDSVVLGSHAALQQVLGRISIDAAVGRQPNEIAKRIAIRRSEHRLGKTVVIHMGTNGYVREQDLSPILSSLKDRLRVVVVNVRVPRVWGQPSNNSIAKIVNKFPNVRVANWYARSAGHPEYFVPDGVHLTPKGANVFAYLIKRALYSR